MIPKAAFWAIALFGWAALSLLWSADPRGGAVELSNGATLLAVYLFAAIAPRERMSIQPVAVCLIAGAIVLSIIFPHWNAGFANENFQAEFFLIALPLLFAASGRWGLSKNDHWIPCGLLAIVGAGFIVANPSNLKFIGASFCIAWVCLLLVRAQEYAFASIVALGAAVVGLWSGVLTRPDIIDSVANRAELHIGTLAMWLASPLFGHGVGSFNVEYPNFQEAYLSWMPLHESIFAWDITKFAGAAHNEYFQILADYGLVGFVLFVGLAYSTFGKWRDGRDVACVASLVMAAIVSLIEFPAQTPHTGALIAFCAGYLANGANLVKISLPRPVRIGLAGVVTALVVFVGGVSVRTAQASVPFANAYFSINERQNYLDGVAWNIEAYNTFSWPRHIRHQLAITLSVLIARDPSGVQIDPALVDKIFEISAQAAGRSVAVEVARVEYLFESGRYHAEREEVEERIAWLMDRASKHAATWLVYSKFALLYGDKPSAIAGAERALSFKNTVISYREIAREILALASTGDEP